MIDTFPLVMVGVVNAIGITFLVVLRKAVTGRRETIRKLATKGPETIMFRKRLATQGLIRLAIYYSVGTFLALADLGVVGVFTWLVLVK